MAQSNKGKGVYFIDSVAAFEQHSPHNTPGQELFYEHVHLNFTGNYILAQAVFRQVEKILPRQIKSQRVNSAVITEEQCADKLAYTDWDKYIILKSLLDTQKTAPYTQRLYNNDLIRHLEQELKDRALRIDRKGLETAKQQYLRAIENSPADGVLRVQYARLLKGLKEPRAAAEQYRVITELWPHSYMYHAGYARALVNIGEFDAAMTSIQTAVRLNPDSCAAYNTRGTIYFWKRDYDRALQDYDKAIELNPMKIEPYDNRGMVYARKGELDKAIRDVKKSLQLALDAGEEELARHIRNRLELYKAKRP